MLPLKRRNPLRPLRLLPSLLLPLLLSSPLAIAPKRVPMTRVRATVAKRLVEAQSNMAMLTTFNEVDMTEVMALRSKYKDLFEKSHNGVRWASCRSSSRLPPRR